MTEGRKTLTAVVVEAALDRKALNIVGLNTREVTSFADEFILATGTSDRHVRAVADAIMVEAKAFGRAPLGVEGLDEGRWILIDFGDIIVHIFQEEVREHYDLERLWSEAPALDFTSMGVSLPAGLNQEGLNEEGSKTDLQSADRAGRDATQTNGVS